jgi:TetR/AcrR family transcriptional regulator, cholesterol catabolism regulator
MRRKQDVHNSKADDKKAAIEKVAANLFSRKSYLETSLKDVADAAGLSKGGIYHYFSSKDEVLYSVLNRFMSEGVEELEKKLQNITDSHSRLLCIISHIIEQYANDSRAAKTLLYDLRLLAPDDFEAIAKKQKRYLSLSTDTLKECLGERADDKDLTSIAFMLMGMCTWVYTWYKPDGPIAPKHLAQIIYDIFVTGIDGYSRGVAKSKKP